MQVIRLVVAAGLILGVTARSAVAQPSERALTPLEVAVGCAPPPSMDIPDSPLRVVGAQDTVRRIVFNTADLLIVDGGTSKGVQLGQQYYIRRPIVAGSNRTRPRGLLTLGWLRIVAVNEHTAIARIDHFCDGVYAGDYLEPFVAPSLPALADGADPPGELNFQSLGRVLYGVEDHSAGAPGDLMLIDRGSDQEMAVGSRFAVYRDVRTGGIPLASVGEGVVLSVGKTMAVARITRSRDAIVSGDYVVPRK